MALVNKMYQDIANDPQMKNEVKLRNRAKKLLNRARVRIQTIENKGAETSGYLKAKENLRESGLLTAGGNVSMKLPKTREKLLMTLLKITSFLENAETTIRGQRKKQKEQKAKTGARKGKHEKAPKHKPKVGEYWRLARDYGLFSIIDYKYFSLVIEKIRDTYSIEEFEELIIKQIQNPDNIIFWHEVEKKMKEKGSSIFEFNDEENEEQEEEQSE
jgi:hypothetical protein